MTANAGTTQPVTVGQGANGQGETGPASATPRARTPPMARPWSEVALVAALTALALALRWRTLWTNYWGDEAIAISISAHSIGSLPRYLVNDGSPPLYYVALHYWMALFGRSEVATHALSLIAGLLAVPAAWWSARRLWGRREARIAAALVATCAYLDYYSTETRMYSWLVLVALLAVTFFALACRDGGLRYWAAAAVFTTMTLYLQYFGLYLLTAMVGVGLMASARRALWAKARATAVFACVCAAAFAPWAPQFLDQLRQTGAPWSPHPSLADLFADSFNALASAGWAGIVVAIAVATVGYRRARRQQALTVQAFTAQHTPDGSPGGSGAVPLILAVCLGTLALAWGVGQVVNAWDPRYLGIVVVPALLPLAGALGRARWGRLAAGVAVVSLTATAVPMLVDRETTVLTAKSDFGYVATQLKQRLRPGALVIVSRPNDSPLVSLDLGPAYRYASPLGLLSDPGVVDWSHLVARLQAANVAARLGPLVTSLPVGGQVVFVTPTLWGQSESPAHYTSVEKAQATAADNLVVSDPQLSEVHSYGVPRYSNPLYPVEATLFVKVRR